MMRQPDAKPTASDQGKRLISRLRRLFFLVYIFIWGFICFGFRILRMLFSKIVITVLYAFSRLFKKQRPSREDSSD